MSPVFTIAGKEFRDGIRNRWVVAATALMAALALALTALGSAPTGNVGVGPLTVTVVSLSSLTIFLVPLIALLVSYEAIVGEMERGTLMLLLSYPVARWHIIVGKFLGHTALLAVATTVGYGAAALAVGFGEGGGDGASWRAFAALVGSSILLGAVFVAIGYVISVCTRDRGTAGGLAVAAWLVLVLLYDLALLGLLVADKGQLLDPTLFDWVLVLNPADSFRLFNLSGAGHVGALSGMSGLGSEAGFSASSLVLAMVAWVVVPLALAGAVLKRKEV
jgi:Cu-processing system permease protein